MARMKDRNRFPPGEFQVLHPEIGMREPFHGSFHEAVTFEIRFRKANPGICQINGWSTDLAEVETYVDNYNALRMNAGGWTEFIHDPSPLPELSHTAEKKTLLASVVDKSRALRAGAGTYAAMFGDDGLATAQEAEARAAVCVKCPQNNITHTLWGLFTASAAAEITQVIEHLHGVSMVTSHDAKLGVCDACLCPMKAKVWAALGHIVKNMPKDVVPKLDVNCWIRAGLQ